MNLTHLLVPLTMLQTASAFSRRAVTRRIPSALAVSQQDRVAAFSSDNKSAERQHLLKLFNKQVANELTASQLYLAASIWFDRIEMVGMSSYMLEESNEEREHALGFIDFANKRDFPIHLEDLESPDANWESPKEVWADLLEAEKTNTEALLALANAAQACNDHAVMTFLNPFHMEQVESEDKMKTILAKVHDEDKTGESSLRPVD